MKVLVRNIFGKDSMILDDSSVIQFGEGLEMITIEVTGGKVNVCAARGYPLLIEPRSANLIRVSVNALKGTV